MKKPVACISKLVFTQQTAMDLILDQFQLNSVGEQGFWARMLLFVSVALFFSGFQAIGSEDITQYFTLQGIRAMPSSATANTIGNMENRQI